MAGSSQLVSVETVEAMLEEQTKTIIAEFTKILDKKIEAFMLYAVTLAQNRNPTDTMMRREIFEKVNDIDEATEGALDIQTAASGGSKTDNPETDTDIDTAKAGKVDVPSKALDGPKADDLDALYPNTKNMKDVKPVKTASKRKRKAGNDSGSGLRQQQLNFPTSSPDN